MRKVDDGEEKKKKKEKEKRKGKGKGIDSCYSALLYLRSSYNTNSLTWTIGGESVQVSTLMKNNSRL